MNLPMINFSEPFPILVALILFGLVLILSRETKKSYIMGIMLGAFLLILIGHAIELATIGYEEILRQTVAKSITYDLIFIFISFISYLWVDDIETKLNKKKSIDNSLDWFWKKV